MSVHLFIAAAYLEDLDPSVKWVLAAIADSADEHTLESAPGLPKLRAWSGRSKSQVTRIVGDLEASGHIARISPGRLGRRAVYRVFPNGVPAIPHPDEVRDRFVVPNVDNPADNPQIDAEEGRTHAPHRGASEADRGAPMRPLQSSTSVSRASATSDNGRRCGQSTSSTSTGSGFPGSRSSSREAAEEAAGIARRARGANDVPCPLHPDHVHPCRRCAHESSKADPEAAEANRKAAREAIARNRRARTTTATTTEETRTA